MFPENKKIGIDLDETIASVFEAVFEYTKTFHPHLLHLKFSDFTHHDWWKIDALGFSKEEAIACWKKFDEINPLDTKISPVPLSQEGIRLLKEHGYKLHAITGRSESSRRQSTEAWINRHFPDVFESLTFTNHVKMEGKIHKSEVCKRLGIELMVEDNLDFSLELAENGIKSYVLEQPWNRNRTERHENIKRVANWQEIIDDIQKTHG
ncbi:TPA: hypothetical protein DCZ36_02080 [Candidatus Gracilibacteria bacterium]|nr:hypothetical protein [Candidatus Gracilibacteria bacterium]